MNRICIVTAKIVGIILASVVALVLLVLAVLNAAKFAIYRDYYAMEETLCKNPGLSDGFVCQGIAAAEEHGVLLVSGYMKDKSASRIYVTTTDNESYYVELSRGDKSFTGHAGGIATTGDTVYIANGSRIFTLSLTDLLSAKEGDTLDVGDGIEVNNSASFVYTDDTYLYVGEFHDGGKYTIEGHEYDSAEGMHYAICTQYALSDLSTPLKVYSIRNSVQGMCFTPDGKIILSTSYGLSDTVYYVYNADEATDAQTTLDGAPVYYLDKVVDEIHGPAMGEDLDYYDGTVITLTESASNKYIFGKFFNARHIVRLSF
ncbi:MAG: hypothetical protein IJW83_01305 [Clostridia bacterium]|nr:hypothetical protein [Clostridia bacterium]